MNRIESLREKAKANKKTVVLPEGDDLRVVEAASIIGKEQLCNIILLGDKKFIEENAAKNKWSMENVKLIDPSDYERADEIANKFYEIRKHKGISPEDAKEQVMSNHVNFGALMTRLGIADGFVAGANHTTGDVARAAIYCLSIDRNIGIVSSSFLMELKDCPFGEDGLFVFGDCGIIPDPISRQLAGIAMSCGRLIEELFDIKARVALLSYSTKGSASGKTIEKVQGALQRIKEKAPDLIVDGELQADAAVVPDVARRKCPESKVEGKANVLVFPNLDAGNICYKLTQRLGRARVVGPLLNGLTKPASDLSRGCGIQEIVDAVVVTAIRAQYLETE